MKEWMNKVNNKLMNKRTKGWINKSKDEQKNEWMNEPGIQMYVVLWLCPKHSPFPHNHFKIFINKISKKIGFKYFDLFYVS